MTKILNQESEKYLGQLIEACGVSGNTREVSDLLEKRLSSAVEKILPDEAGLGFFQAIINSNKKFRVMLSSHMDTVGLRVSHIDEKGFCFLLPVGGIDLLSIKGQRVKIATKEGNVKGIIQGIPIHHLMPDARYKNIELSKFFVRTEYTGKKGSPIRIGDPVYFSETMHDLGDDTLTAPGFDNRLGCFLMTETLRALKANELDYCLMGVASCGEEIGCRGIRALTQKISPDLAIVLDVTNVTDYPGANLKKFGHHLMGKGPIIARGYNTRTTFNDHLINLATELNINYQLRAEDITATDGRETDEAGVPTLVIRVPGCMLHTSNDTVLRKDIEATGILIQEFLKRLPANF